MNWGEASESDSEESATETECLDQNPTEKTHIVTDGRMPEAEVPPVQTTSHVKPTDEDEQCLQGNDVSKTTKTTSDPGITFQSCDALMLMAKPLSTAVRVQLDGLLAEQKRLLSRLREKRDATNSLPHMKEMRNVLEKIPEYQKKLIWIKKSMDRTRSIIDQTKRESLALQAKVYERVQHNQDRKLAEARRDEELKAKVVTER